MQNSHKLHFINKLRLIIFRAVIQNITNRVTLNCTIKLECRRFNNESAVLINDNDIDANFEKKRKIETHLSSHKI